MGRSGNVRERNSSRLRPNYKWGYMEVKFGDQMSNTWFNVIEILKSRMIRFQGFLHQTIGFQHVSQDHTNSSYLFEKPSSGWKTCGMCSSHKRSVISSKWMKWSPDNSTNFSASYKLREFGLGIARDPKLLSPARLGSHTKYQLR